jgi:hypothetical protein
LIKILIFENLILKLKKKQKKKKKKEEEEQGWPIHPQGGLASHRPSHPNGLRVALATTKEKKT